MFLRDKRMIFTHDKFTHCPGIGSRALQQYMDPSTMTLKGIKVQLTYQNSLTKTIAPICA